MHNEHKIRTATVNGTTVVLTKHNKHENWFRYIITNDETYEIGFDNRKQALSRYERDLANLRGARQ